MTIEYSYPLAIEARIPGGWTDNAVVNPGESFFSTDGTTWVDGTKVTLDNEDDEDVNAANACIKGFTFVPDERRAEDWTIRWNGDRAELSIPLFLSSAPSSVQVTGTGLTDIEAAFEREADTGSANAAASDDPTGEFYTLNVSCRAVSRSDAAITGISVDGQPLEMPSGGVMLNDMSGVQKSNGSSSGCDAGLGGLGALALCLAFRSVRG